MSKNIMSENEETSKDSPDGSSSAPRAGILRLWGSLGEETAQTRRNRDSLKGSCSGKKWKATISFEDRKEKLRIVKRSFWLASTGQGLSIRGCFCGCAEYRGHGKLFLRQVS